VDALLQQRSQIGQYLLEESNSEGVVGSKLRQFVIYIFYHIYLCLFQKHQILLLILFTVIFQCALRSHILDTLPEGLPLSHIETIILAVGQLLR
jgi:hypothetical protein